MAVALGWLLSATSISLIHLIKKSLGTKETLDFSSPKKGCVFYQ
jgi:hypothetical protein